MNCRKKIELDSTISGQVKVKSLKSLETLLKGYNRYKGQKDFPATIAPALVKAFTEALAADRKGESIEPIIAKNEYGVGKILVECFIYPSENIGVKSSRVLLIKKYLETHPDEILSELNKNPYLSFCR